MFQALMPHCVLIYCTKQRQAAAAKTGGGLGRGCLPGGGVGPRPRVYTHYNLVMLKAQKALNKIKKTYSVQSESKTKVLRLQYIYTEHMLISPAGPGRATIGCSMRAAAASPAAAPLGAASGRKGPAAAAAAVEAAGPGRSAERVDRRAAGDRWAAGRR